MAGGSRQRGGAPPKEPPPQNSGSPPPGGDEGGGGVALKKEIGLLSACGIIVGNIIGSGIFVSPRGVLGNAGSVGVALAVWAATGVVTALGALCYAELGATIPKSGGDYAYVKDIFGGMAGFLRLWISVLVIYPTNQAVIALTFASYVLRPLFPAGGAPEPGLRLLAAACLLLLTWLNSFSVRGATRLQDACTAGKLLALALIVAAGAWRLATGHAGWLQPPLSFSWLQPPEAGRVAMAFLQGSFAYGGWNFLNYVTEELVEPERNLPRAIFISIPLVTAVYILANVAYVTAMTPYEILQSDAVAVTFGEKALGPLAWLMPAAVALSTFGGVNGSLFTGSRLFYAGAREGQLPALLAMIHLRRRTPIPALLVTCVSTLLMLVSGDTYTLISYVGFANHLWYGVAVAGLLVLRWREPHRPRPIRVPLVLPGLYLLLWGALGVLALLREPLACGVGLAVTAAGAPVYLLALRPRNKPPALHRAVASLTRLGQQLCLVVYPLSDPQPHSAPHSEPHSDPQPHSEPHSDPRPHSAPHGDPKSPGEEQQPLAAQPHN